MTNVGNLWLTSPGSKPHHFDPTVHQLVSQFVRLSLCLFCPFCAYQRSLSMPFACSLPFIAYLSLWGLRSVSRSLLVWIYPTVISINVQVVLVLVPHRWFGFKVTCSLASPAPNLCSLDPLFSHPYLTHPQSLRLDSY